ncbi:MAG TPA: 3-phosphoserine/phosphohydroxythreonine transaminase [Gammaproteobacteria bacterium]|nr:3-phosphoserine/phosphohydroxythreonine transaminase [Gammaproteobacteria bacterium]
MSRVYNFSAGPATLPEEVLRQAQEEMLDWHGLGMSIMEVGHRGPEFQGVLEQTEADMREVLNIPANYHVLFVAGGASTQFAMVPLNLLSEENKAADYIQTGMWSQKAVQEAKKYGDINVAATTKTIDGIHTLPLQNEWHLNPKAAYVHYTPNETVDAIEFHWVPNTGPVPLVADMTSSIMSKPIDVNQYGLIYAGAQKNVGQAGITVVIVKSDLVKKALWHAPTLYTYEAHVEQKSCYNTPPTYAIYFAGLMMQWIKRQGGLKVIGERNIRKAKKLYDCIDTLSGFYVNKVDPKCRAIMNVVFSLREEALTDEFLSQATEAGLAHLRGHRAVGGCRASIYNAMPEAGVDRLVEFMTEFAKKHG